MLINFSLVGERVGFNIFGEPLLELLVTVEKPWHNKMQEGPELSHRILNRRSSEQQSISGIKLE